ncbi:pantoate--beta-alanine ligase [Leucothrix arctica]|uniref:Pantothenate synthetase n=1 Tax=Leucothrix arctica TaxID=1481894 RepID=A0A317CIA8_9GAMM|nr:pantoate--beta-alanine ligase [Leucothrix arctica]PWQ98295.1 pantoate--beta-alanine ligase [Leucothrix arctica]
MQVITSIAQLRKAINTVKSKGHTVGFVPTMGNLHEGHLDLVKRASDKAQCSVVSIFVNPTQFDRADDLDAYPRTMEADLAKLEAIGTDIVFCPEPKEMYPYGGLVTQVDVPAIGSLLEGSSRPGHFCGVATVVCKLFNIVAPDLAVFGQKDFQQLMVIRQMVADLDMPLEIIGAPTVREKDGLAMSSRNNRLTSEQREIAPVLNKLLEQLKAKLLEGNKAFEVLQEEVISELAKAGFKPDYIKVCHAKTLQLAEQGDSELVILAAAFLGDVRLIDNVPVTLAT